MTAPVDLAVPVAAAVPVFSVAVTGHQVVYRVTTSVVTWPTGQLVTVGAQEVMV